MGSITSRPRARDEEADIASALAYRYPPRSGYYFANYFIMGGEKFETPQPESYLFGENTDLNFLGNRPAPFPYPPAQTNDPTRPLKCLVNVRKESVRLVRSSDDSSKTSYNVEFVFDTDIRCSIIIYAFCTEDISSSGIVYSSDDPTRISDVFYYKRGTNQYFSQPSFTFDPSTFGEENLVACMERGIIPLAIQCTALEGADETKQSHITVALLERQADGSYTIKTLKQKLFVDGLCYLLQEIYGIENKPNGAPKDVSDDDVEDGGLECVICMSEMRDTLILPCRHLCLCQECANSLRYQANNCPICRSPFRALLQIKAIRKANAAYSPAHRSISHESSSSVVAGVPPGFEHISLIEALNGPATIPTIPLANMGQDEQNCSPSAFHRSNIEGPVKQIKVKTSSGSKKGFGELRSSKYSDGTVKEIGMSNKSTRRHSSHSSHKKKKPVSENTQREVSSSQPTQATSTTADDETQEDEVAQENDSLLVSAECNRKAHASADNKYGIEVDVTRDVVTTCKVEIVEQKIDEPQEGVSLSESPTPQTSSQ